MAAGSHGVRMMHRSLRRIGAVTLAFVACSGLVTAAHAADAENIGAGMELFLHKGNCQACHGWSGDGRKVDNQMPDGANLRESKLDRNTFVMLVKCGLPGTGMPPFDKFAYSDGRCYGKKAADLTTFATRMPDAPATLQPREIELLADFMMAKVVRQGPMNHAKCVEFWGPGGGDCNEFPK